MGARTLNLGDCISWHRCIWTSEVQIHLNFRRKQSKISNITFAILPFLIKILQKKWIAIQHRDINISMHPECFGVYFFDEVSYTQPIPLSLIHQVLTQIKMAGPGYSSVQYWAKLEGLSTPIFMILQLTELGKPTTLLVEEPQTERERVVWQIGHLFLMILSTLTRGTQV